MRVDSPTQAFVVVVIGGGHAGTEAAVDGVMARATDLATMRFRMLKRREGPAVCAPCAQAAGIPGVTPSDPRNLMLEVERWQRG
jgi:tRNA U34 5-carboxymethylaminomethyl modifying enzyme MnmG/GidA